MNKLRELLNDHDDCIDCDAEDRLVQSLYDAREEIADLMDAYEDFIDLRTDTGWLHLDATLNKLNKRLNGEG